MLVLWCSFYDGCQLGMARSFSQDGSDTGQKQLYFILSNTLAQMLNLNLHDMPQRGTRSPHQRQPRACCLKKRSYWIDSGRDSECRVSVSSTIVTYLTVTRVSQSLSSLLQLAQTGVDQAISIADWFDAVLVAGARSANTLVLRAV